MHFENKHKVKLQQLNCFDLISVRLVSDVVQFYSGNPNKSKTIDINRIVTGQDEETNTKQYYPQGPPARFSYFNCN